MTIPSTSRSRASAVAALLVVSSFFLFAGPARAQDPFATMGTDASGGAEPAPAGAKRAAKAPAADPDDQTTPSPNALGPFERLPGSAYPAWKRRGIDGGSLWFSGNMHGMPWPYYPRTGIGVSGYAWADTGYETIDRGQIAQPDIKYLVSQARAALRVTPTYSEGPIFLQGQIELIANKDQSVTQPNVADVDDLWIRFGQWKKWDFQLGRFEAFEVYHFGMGLDLNTLERDGATDQRTPPDVYGLRTTTYRQSGIGNFAFHVYPLDFVRFELLGQFGFDAATPLDTMAVRPALVLDFGWLKLKGAGDYRRQTAVFSTSKESRNQRGGVGAVQLVLYPYLELGVNVAYGLVDHWAALNTTDPNATMGDYDTEGSTTDIDYGGFANFRVMPGLIFGGGVNRNTQTDQKMGEFTHLQAFGAVQYVIAEHLFVKLVGAYAAAHFAPGGVASWDNTMVSGRVRLMYLF